MELNMKKKKIIIFQTTIILILIIIIITTILLTKERQIKLILAGDALVTENTLEDAYNKETNTYHFKKMFTKIKDYIKDYDLAYYNQETSISGSQFNYLGYDCYNTPEQFGLDMIDTGFNMVSLANNHTFDGELGVVNGRRYCYKSEQGAVNSIKFWNSQKKVYTSGSYLSEEQRNKIVIKEKNGITYTLLSYTYGLNIPEGHEKSPYLVNIYSDEQVKKDVEKVRDKVDVIIVSMHWGVDNEQSFIPNTEQKQQAKYLASLGVDIIVGHHPYVIEPIEWIDNTLVFYSLGRIISSKTYLYNDYSYVIGLLGEVTITKKNNQIKIENTNNELIYNYYDEFDKNNLIIPFSQMTETYNKDYKRLYEKYSQIVKMYDNNTKVNKIS